VTGPRHMTGRSAELDVLADRAEAARAGTAQAVLVRGPAGIGKTTLLDAVRTREARRGTTVLAAACAEASSGYGAVRDLFAPLDLTSEDSRSSALLHGSARWALPALMSGEDPAHAVAQADPYSVLHGLYWLAVNLMADGPLMIVLDDVHRADTRSLRWVDFLLRRSTDLPLLVLLAQRIDTIETEEAVLAEITGQSLCHVMDLRPLSEADIAEMIEHRLGEVPERSFSLSCAEVSRGNPLVANRLLDSLSLEGVRPDASGARRAEQVGGDVVAASVGARLDRQPDDVRQVAKAMAVLAETDAELLGMLSGVPMSRVANAMEVLRRNDILAPEGGAFSHDLVRAAVLAEVPDDELRRLRERAARLLNDLARPVEQVANQVLLLPPSNETWRLDVLREAASRAAVRSAPEAAVRYLERVLSCDPNNVAVALELSWLMANLDPPEALRQAKRALEQIDDPRLRASMAVPLGLTAIAAQASSEAVVLLAEILDQLNAQIGQHPSDAERELRMSVEGILLFTGIQEKRTVAETLARARMIPVPAGHTATERQLLALLGLVAAMEGKNVQRSIEHVHQAVRVQEMEHYTGLAEFSAAFAAALADEPDMAFDKLEWVLAETQRRGSVWAHCQTLAIRAWVFEQVGELAEAMADAQTAVEIAEQEGFGQGTERPRRQLAAVLLLRGQPDRAEEMLEQIDVSRLEDFAWEHAEFLFTRGRTRSALGDHEGALDYFRQCGRSLAESHIANPVFAPWWLHATGVLTALGRPAEAMPLVEHGEELAGDWPTTRSTGSARLARGIVTPGRAGVDLIDEAVSLLADSSSRLWHGYAEYLFGRALLAIGDMREARKHARQAVALAVRCGCSLLATQAREFLLTAGGRMPAIPRSRTDSLTGSERRVVRLAAAGHTNREIAEHLFVTVRTVEMHIMNAFRKLGVSRREDLPAVLDPRPLSDGVWSRGRTLTPPAAAGDGPGLP
jgi:DNA-binding CsgD family transcriptional regulator/tetratricopeptide (TPR) repeat protein